MKKIWLMAALAAVLAAPVAFADDGYPDAAGNKGSEQAQMAPQHHDDADHQMFPGLSQSSRDILKQTMQKTHEDNKALIVKMKKLHTDLQAIITAPTFDDKAYIAKKGDLSKLEATMKTNMTKAMASALAQLPQNDRKIIASAMEKHHHWHHGHDGHEQPAAPSSDE